MNNTGDLPYSTSVGTDTEHVELSTGNLIVHIPFVDVPGRKMTFNFGIRYDSRFWSYQMYPSGLQWNPEQSNWITSTALGWTPTQGYLTYSTGKVQCANSTGNPGSNNLLYNSGGTWADNYLFTDNQGRKHSFYVNQFLSGECEQTTGFTTPFDASNYVGPSTDLDGFYAAFDVPTGQPKIEGPDGTFYGYGGTSGGTSQGAKGLIFVDAAGESDPRGNGQVISPGGTDSIGRTPVTQQVNGNQIIYQVHDSNGVLQNYVVNLETIPVATNFGVTGIADYVGSRQVVASVVLPNQQSYSFAYQDGWGEITQITLPTGAVVNYQWTTINTFSAGALRAVSKRTVSHDGQTDVWNFSYPSSNPNIAVTTVTGPADALGNRYQTLYTYDLYQHLSRVQYLSSPSGSQLLQYDLAWDNTRQGPTSASAENSLLASITTTLENGLVSLKTFQYDLYAFPSQNKCTSPLNVGSWCFAFSGGSYGPPTNLPPPLLYPGSHGNVTAIQEYDWGQGAPGPLLRQTLRTYLQDTNSNYFAASAKTTSAGANPLVNIANRVVTESIYDGSAVCNGTGTMASDGSGTIIPPAPCHAKLLAQTNVTYDNGSPSSYGYYGEATSISRWNNNFGSPAITTSYVYDGYGNIISETDPNSNKTQYSYSDIWSGSSACATQNPANAYLTTITNALGQQSQQTYYGCTGKLASKKDPNDLANGRSGTTYAYDLMGRTTTVNYPDGGQTTTIYNDSARTVDVQTLINAGQTHEALTLLDNLGRKMQSQILSDPEGTVYEDTQYDALGRVASVSTPYRSKAETTYGVTQTYYDARSRKMSQIQADSTSLSWLYTGNCATLTEEDSKTWTRCSDALGRLTSVLEPGGIPTKYTYDGLNNLSSVTQTGNGAETPRVRSFTFDSLSRLITSTNPETGTICYGTWSASACAGGYDADGNLLYKTDARGITSSYTYDALNRLTHTGFSDGSPQHIYNYDQSSYAGFNFTNPIGRLTFETVGSGNSTQLFSYDSMGNINTETLCTPSNCGTGAYSISSSHDLAGNMTDLTYPDGHHIQQSFSSAGRLLTSNLVDVSGAAASANYLQGINYFPDGSTSQVTLGNGVVQTIGKNNRMQVQSITASTPLEPSPGQVFLSHTYCYVNCTTGGTANNGNIWGITDTLNAAKTLGYTYDALNRIGSFSLGGTPAQTYNTDSFGNITQLAGENPLNSFDPSTNRINNLPCAASLQPFDAAGNQLCDTDANGAIRQYGINAESRIAQISILGSGSPFVSYIYSADGGRARKSNADGTFAEYVYFAGQPIAQRDQTGVWTDYIYANGQKIAKVSSAETLIHQHGNNTQQVESGMGFAATMVRPLQSGDKVSWRQYNGGNGISAGIAIYFTDGSNTAWTLSAYDGYCANCGGGSNQWVTRTADLSGFAGKTVSSFAVLDDTWSALGRWDVWYADVAIYGLDGVVQTLFNRIPLSIGSLYVDIPSGQTEGQVCMETGSSCVAATSAQPTNAGPLAASYYMDDHLGTAQMELAGGGWPIWQGQFTPFGQELDTEPTTMHYKFTGKERDAESGLDYFGARYYGSSMGRWMSPDWADKPEAVPYSSLDDPQTLNLYQYVRNNPLSTPDIDGHGWWSDFGNGLANSTYRPLGQAIAHPINTVEGIGHALAHPITTSEAIGSGIKSTAVSVTQGDGLAIGTAVGTVGMALVPGVGEAGEGAEAAADLSRVSEAGQATSKVDQIVNTIDQGGFNVTQNAKTAGQDANVTITHPNEPGVNLNLRSESHPLPGSGGQPVPHVNVEKVTPRTGSTPKQVDNRHITQ